MRAVIFLTLLTMISLITNGQEIVIPDALKNDCDVYTAKGRWGKQFNQVITFGDYSTSKIKKGWTKTTTATTSTFIGKDLTYSQSSQKFSFEQYDGSGLNASVMCSGKLSGLYMDVVKNFFQVGTQFTNVFSGVITINGQDTVAWDFSVNDPGHMPDIKGNTSGAIYRQGSTAILLYAVSELDGKKVPKLLQTQQGYVFMKDDQAIGAVSLYNKGVVTFKKGIPEDQKLVMAALSTALMVRADLEEN